MKNKLKISLFLHSHILFIFFLSTQFFLPSLSQTVNWGAHPNFQVSSHTIITPNSLSGRTAVLNSYTSPTYTTVTAASANIRIIFGITGLSVNGSSSSLSLTIRSWSITNTGYKFNVTILNQTVIYKLKIDSALIDVTMPEIYYRYEEYTFNKINQGSGYRSQNFTFPMSSTPTFLPVAAQLQFLVYLHGFNLYFPTNATAGTAPYIIVNTFYNLTDYAIEFVVRDQMIAQFAHFTVIIVDLITNESPNYKMKFLVLRGLCPGATCPIAPAGSGMWIANADFITTGNILFGLSFICYYRPVAPNWYMDTSNLNTLDANHLISGGNCEYINIFSIAVRKCVTPTDFYDPSDKTCKASCALSTYSLNNVGNLVCARCDYRCLSATCAGQGQNQCTTCNAAYYREPSVAAPPFKCQCMTNYVDIGIQQCKACYKYLPGCKACSSVTACQTCLTTDLKIVSGKCVCQDNTKSLTRYGQCIALAGCFAYFLDPVTGTNKCTQCNVKGNFTLANYQCACYAGYSLHLSADGLSFVCTPDPQVCGDGILTISEECDDNAASYDGCDTNCKVEPGYLCYADLRETSFCLQSKTVLKYIGAMKIQGQPSAQAYFSLQPVHPFLKNTTILLKYLKSTLLQFSTFYDYSYQVYQDSKNRRIITRIKFKYKYEIDASVLHSATFNVSDSSKYFESTVNFNLTGANLQLLMLEGDQKYESLNYILLTIIILAYLVAIASIFHQRWIGIQLLQTFQFCFFYFILQNHVDQKQRNLLKVLEYANGINIIDYQFSYFEYMTFDDRFYTMNYKKQFLLNFNLTAVIFAIPLILIILKIMFPTIIKYCVKQKKVRKITNPISNSYQNNTQQSSLKTFQEKYLSSQFIFGKIFITLNLWFINQIAMTFYIEQNPNLSESQIYDTVYSQAYSFFFQSSILVTLGLIIMAAIKPYKFQHAMQKENESIFIRFKYFSSSYALVYSIFNFIKIMMIGLLFSDHFSVYVLISLDILYLIGFCIVRPYQKQTQEQDDYCFQIHNLHNVWNSLGLIGLSIFIILEINGFISDQQTQNILIRIVILIICFGSLIFAILRVFGSYKLGKITKDCCKKENQDKVAYQIQNFMNETERQMRKRKIQNKLEVKGKNRPLSKFNQNPTTINSQSRSNQSPIIKSSLSKTNQSSIKKKKYKKVNKQLKY